MLSSLHRLVTRWANWPVLALLLLGYLGCMQGFTWRQQKLGHREILDTKVWYTPSEAHRLLEDLGEEGRRLYAITQLTLDGIFPFVYAGMIAVLVVRLYRGNSARFLVLLPILAAVSDWIENGATAYLALSWTPQTHEPVLAWIAAVATATKSLMLLCSLGIILTGAILGMLQKPGSEQAT